MSYCRWSCDDFKSDVYCYEGEGGYITHVTTVRVDPHTKVETPIELPHVGESFCDRSLEDFNDRLRYLQKCGYYVPDKVFPAIRMEMHEELISRLRYFSSVYGYPISEHLIEMLDDILGKELKNEQYQI